MRAIVQISICFLSVVLFMALFLISVNAIHMPVGSKAIALPLGEQNRVEDRWPVKDRDPYVEVENVDISVLPKSAWCRSPGKRSDRYLVLQCAWPISGGVVKFQTAYVGVKLPSTDVMNWRFDRKSLAAVPTTETWLLANFWYLVSATLCLIIAVASLCLGIDPTALRRHYSEAEA